MTGFSIVCPVAGPPASVERAGDDLVVTLARGQGVRIDRETAEWLRDTLDFVLTHPEPVLDGPPLKGETP